MLRAPDPLCCTSRALEPSPSRQALRARKPSRLIPSLPILAAAIRAFGQVQRHRNERTLHLITERERPSPQLGQHRSHLPNQFEPSSPSSQAQARPLPPPRSPTPTPTPTPSPSPSPLLKPPTRARALSLPRKPSPPRRASVRRALQPVSDARHRLHVVARGSQLSSEARDVGVDRARADVRAAPDDLEQRLAR